MDIKTDKVREALENAKDIISRCDKENDCKMYKTLFIAIQFFDEHLSTRQAEWFDNKLEIGNNHLAFTHANDDGSYFCEFYSFGLYDPDTEEDHIAENEEKAIKWCEKKAKNKGFEVVNARKPKK
jgi:hypothetical protein